MFFISKFSYVLDLKVKDKYITSINESKTCFSAQRQPSGFSLINSVQFGLDNQKTSYFKVSLFDETTNTFGDNKY